MKNNETLNCYGRNPAENFSCSLIPEISINFLLLLAAATEHREIEETNVFAICAQNPSNYNFNKRNVIRTSCRKYAAPTHGMKSVKG